MSAAVQLPSFDFEAIADLKSRMAQFTTTFDKFIAAGRDQLRRDRDAFACGMAEDRAAQRSTEDAIEATRAAQVMLEAQLENERREVEEMQRSIDEYSAKKEAMDALKQDLERQHGVVKEAMAQKRDVMSEKRAALAVQNLKNKPELGAWEQQLGLTIDGAGQDVLRFTFTHLNARDVNMPHWFTMDLGTHTYAVQECHPALPGMQQRIEELNRTREFSAFLKQVRKDFKALY